MLQGDWEGKALLNRSCRKNTPSNACDYECTHVPRHAQPRATVGSSLLLIGLAKGIS